MLRQMLINDGGGRSSKAARGNDGALWNEGKKKTTTTSKKVEPNKVITSLKEFVTPKSYIKKTPGKPVQQVNYSTGKSKDYNPKTTPNQDADAINARFGGSGGGSTYGVSGYNTASGGMGPVWEEKLKTLKDLITPGPSSPDTYGPDPGGSTLADAGSRRQENETTKATVGYYGPEYVPIDTPKPDPELQKIKDELANLNPVYDDYTGNIGGRPEMRSASDMADKHDIVYDLDRFNKIMRNATNEKYNNLDTEHARNQRDFYRMSGQNAVDLQSALMRGDRQAQMTGASRGTGVAEQLMAMQELGQTSAEGATEIGRLRADLVGQREAELAQNAMDAIEYYNTLGIDLGTLSAREQDAFVQAYGAEKAEAASRYEADMAYKASLKQALAQLEGVRSSNQTQIDIANKTNKFQTDLLNNPSYRNLFGN